ncbi:hypothetical protein PtA15_18A250 [Puccinia triticina]|uniref:Uncharacterized protein n=1 Tax=Puccinia triticina TaxID=208348 RepID=A0ABY7DDW6_9BASI|nr:uncharacterized protein PtA15_18A250 [Puccinia triticina]WAQ93192.1 hypothetical protein PtA15_18A250 [Puccinia triticina]WAR63165.1 hypothetical protein PtB15_18B247 [Puccinia triticina]
MAHKQDPVSTHHRDPFLRGKILELDSDPDYEDVSERSHRKNCHLQQTRHISHNTAQQQGETIRGRRGTRVLSQLARPNPSLWLNYRPQKAQFSVPGHFKDNDDQPLGQEEELLDVNQNIGETCGVSGVNTWQFANTSDDCAAYVGQQNKKADRILKMHEDNNVDLDLNGLAFESFSSNNNGVADDP